METDEQTQEAFGKVNPYRSGILPVLIVMQNDGPDAIRVDKLELTYTLPDNTRIQATPAQDLRYLRGAAKPQGLPGPAGGIHIKESAKESSGGMGDRGACIRREDGSGRAVGQRFYLLSGTSK